MRLGLTAGYSGASLEVDIGFIQDADRFGFDTVWTSVAYGADAITQLAWIAVQTTKIRLGTAIMHMPARSPAMTAMTAMSLDALSGGRFILGLGPSGPQLAPRRSTIISTQRKKSAPVRSILLTKQIRGTPYLSA